ncbi:hypothetical protein ACJMK2_029051 [Sinanodonta woodiana]|uniref:Uncharacterized protein n=1 Tax=Sinanodonta woodiana TaxID=1069815 RepID=A0ABD3X9E8_SINWO
MPSFEMPSYSSSRIQRAYRINNLEQIRLKARLDLLDKEKVHQIRITNQDIRLISMTMDTIQASSGHSPEGLGPDSESDGESIEENKGDPCFLYGERIVSRKKRRFLRPQSAMDMSRNRSEADTMSTTTSVATSVRPRSSPVSRKFGLITSLKDGHRLDVEDIKSEADSGIRSGVSTPHPAWMDETNEITKKLLRAQTGDADGRRSIFGRDNDSIKTKSATGSRLLQRQLRSQIKMQLVDSKMFSSASSMSSSSSFMDVKGSSSLGKISQLITLGGPTMSANQWKKQLSEKRGLPMTSAIHKQQILSTKKAINSERQEVVHNKIKTFMDNYPSTRLSKSSNQ